MDGNTVAKSTLENGEMQIVCGWREKENDHEKRFMLKLIKTVLKS